MAITTLSENEGTITIQINNGDLKALNEAVDKWNFRDKAAALKFALAVLTLTDNGSLLQINSNGNIVPIRPTEAVTRQEQPGG